MSTSFPASVAYGHEHTRVEEYTPSQVAGEVFFPGDFVAWDGTNDWVERAGADPALIYGISEVDSEEARVLTEDGKIPIRKLSANCILAMGSATTPVEATHLGVEYGIVRDANGHWLVDVSETSNVRVKVERLNVAEGIWYCRPLAEFIDDGIDS